MDLGTFGAVLAFAIEMERKAAAFYEASQAPVGLASDWRRLAAGSRKRLGRLERARREGISEMILEAISGLHSQDYGLPTAETADEEALRGVAAALEATMARYYRDSSAKMPVPEIARLFQRLAEENDQRGVQASRNAAPSSRV